MKAWQFVGVHTPLVLADLPDPSPGSGEVLIDVKAAGICHTDVSVLESTRWEAFFSRLPMTLGHEVSGVVTEIGDDVQGVKVGDRVAAWPSAPQGSPGFNFDGAFAPQMVVPADVLAHLPDEVSFVHGAVAMDAGITPHNAVMRQGGVRAGDRVGIIGLGGLGEVGTRLAVLAGADVRVASQRYANPDRCDGVVDLVAEIGAQDVRANIRDFDVEFDVVIDFAGTDTSTSDALNAVRQGGTVVLVAMSRSELLIDTWTLVARQAILRGSIGATREDIDAVFDLISTGRLIPKTSTVAFDEIPAAIDRLRSGDHNGRFVAVFD